VYSDPITGQAQAQTSGEWGKLGSLSEVHRALELERGGGHRLDSWASAQLESEHDVGQVTQPLTSVSPAAASSCISSLHRLTDGTPGAPLLPRPSPLSSRAPGDLGVPWVAWALPVCPAHAFS
jgi:hypothetical protein